MHRYAYLLIACLALIPAAHGAERRVALVIGNSAYQHAPLANPGNDARAIAQALREMGFTVDERRNLNQAVMRRAIREFGDEIAKGGVGLFYYAGHGMQIRGRNFLIPVGSDIRREDEVEDQAVDARLVLEKMASAKNALNLVILDACRNNPFASSFRSATVGLAAMDAPAGTLVAFSTAPGQVAADGSGDNGLYTRYLVSYMREPGLKVEDVFKRVRVSVRQESAGKQTPWENTSLETDFYFRPPDTKALAAEADERRKAQQAAIERAVQEALKRRGEDTSRNQAQIERQIAERVAAERSAAERAAAERIAAIERAAQEAIERTMQQTSKPTSAAISSGQVVATASASEVKPLPPAAVKVPPKPESTSVSAPPAQANLAAGPPDVAPLASAPERKLEEPVRLALAVPSTAAIPAARALVVPKVGDTWTYKVTTRDYGNVSERKSTTTVGAVTDSEIRMGRQATGSRYTHDGNLLYRRSNDGLERTYEPFVPLYTFPLEPGKSWQAKYKMSRSDGRIVDYDMSVTVVGWESVTVPAGTFKAMKLSSTNWYRRIDPGASGSGKIVMSRWYAPEVKRFVKSEIVELGRNNVVYDDNTWELVSYKVQ